MRAEDVLDELLVHVTHPNDAARGGAIVALHALYKQHCPECVGEGATRQIPGESIAVIRESLVVALGAIDKARARHPSGPVGIVANEPDA